MACTTGTLSVPDTDAIFAARPGSTAETDLTARGIRPACGAGMARRQPELHFLYRGVGGPLSLDLDKAAIRHRLLALASLTPPTLGLTAQEDVLMPPTAVEALSRILPWARLVRVPAAGHSVY
jgi:pimeloyl-ACP methyl ester carboxylesterase